MTDSDSDSVFIFDIQHSTFNHSTVQRQLKSDLSYDHRSVLIEHSTFYVMCMFYVYPDITNLNYRRVAVLALFPLT